MVVSTGQASEEEAKYLWAIDLDSIAIAPQILKNHRTNTAEVLVQDFSNTIHLAVSYTHLTLPTILLV